MYFHKVAERYRQKFCFWNFFFGVVYLISMTDFLSAYAQKLTHTSKARYIEKLAVCELKVDPYKVDKALLDSTPDQIPDVQWSDFFVYMISTPSQHTKEEIRAWKSMTGSDSFVQAGWVHDMRLHTYQTDKGNCRYVVLGQVKHSQRMSATPLVPWFAAEKSGEILAAHCTCMAGLGEACSHIAALISCVVKAGHQRKIQGSESCTSQICAWLPAKRNVSAAQVKSINFHKPSNKKQRTSTPTPAKDIAPPSADELRAFHASLKQVATRPVIHHVMDEFAHEFIPPSHTNHFPKPLSTLYDVDTLHLTYPELLQKCLTVADSLKITSSQSAAVEVATRSQSSSKTWFTHRAGRITASIFKTAARTNPAMPSASLIKRVCYPEAFRFSTAAVRWGCDHEKEARGAYLKQEQSKHQNLVAKDCGLTISVEHPFLGATPDGVLHCDCCQPRLLEVKCPFCVRDDLLNDKGDLPKNFCMERTEDGWKLKPDHSYFYQVQAQLNVCKFETCVFVLWTKEKILTHNVIRDTDFFVNALAPVKHAFVTGVLPELVGKWLSRKPVQSLAGTVQVVTPIDRNQNGEEENADSQWCFCEKPSFGQMIGCDSKMCSIKWFHMDCLLIRVPPKGKWYCPSCRKLQKYQNKKKSHASRASED